LILLYTNHVFPPLVLLLKLEYMYQRKHRHHLLKIEYLFNTNNIAILPMLISIGLRVKEPIMYQALSLI